MVKRKKTGLLIIVSGPSGVGKGTICKDLIKHNKDIFISTSMTTRLPREGEKDGREYYFVTKEEFMQRVEEGKFLEYAQVYNDYYYGTPKDKIQEQLDEGKDVILEIDIEGALQVKEKIEEGVFIFLVPPSMKELKKRLMGRQTETKEKVLERLKKAYQEINAFPKYNYIIINDEIEDSRKRIEAIILAEKSRVDRIDDVELNNEEELLHELLMDQK